MKKYILGLMMVMVLLVGCSDKEIVNNNLNKEAEQFKVIRRITFFNGITDKYLLVVEGNCTVDGEDWAGNVGNVLSVICKTGDDEYKKHYLGLSDNVSFFSEQIDAKNVSKYHYKVIFKPKSIIPDIDIK